MTSPRLTAGTLRTCSRLALHQDSQLPPASQARVTFLPVCFVFHLFSEEKTYPATRQPASHQPAVYRVHRWPQEWQGRLRVTHYNPATGLGGEAFWPVADSSLQRNKETEQSQAPLRWVPGEVPGLLQYFLQFPPFPPRVVPPKNRGGGQAEGTVPFGLTLCLWLSRQASVSHL